MAGCKLLKRVFCLSWVLIAPAASAETLAESEALLAGVSGSASTQTGGLHQQGIRAQVTALQRVVLSSEMPGRISKLRGLPGDSFKKGNTLVRFDCTEQKALLKKAQSVEKSAASEVAVLKRLLELDAGGTLEVSKGQARLAESKAEVAVMKARVSRCQINAPFSGRIAKRDVATHEYVRVGTPLLEIFAKDSLEVQLIVPSRWLAKMKKGDSFQVSIEETGKVYTAKVLRTGAVIDPISQSVEIAGQIVDASEELLPGMSGWAKFPHE
ncbi:MAG: efflux RND transporter periplasmic adaptor subunit [Pontibacterium sp.]